MYPQTTRLNLQNIHRIFVGMFVIGLVLLVATFFVKGKLHYDTPANQQLYINGHRVTSNTVSLRPATYTVKIASARYQTVEKQVRILPFATNNYEPEFVERSPSSIVSSAIGAFGYYGPPQIIGYKWFAQDTWFTAQVGPNDIAPIALHYVNGQWHIAYFANPGYPDDITKLPNAVADYVRTTLKQLRQN